MIKIKFLGSGSAFVTGKENYHSNVLITSDSGRKMLYDCGTTINDALDTANIDVMDIDSIFISHLHGDHSGGCEFVGFKTYFSTFPFGEKKVQLISTETILRDLWNKQHSASMNSIDGIDADLNTFFDTMSLLQPDEDKDRIFLFDGIKMYAVETIHSKMESYGLFLPKIGGKKSIFITGDTKFTPEHLSLQYYAADIIFQDCEFNVYPNGVHAQFHELKTLPSHLKEKMYLYHYMLNGKTFEELESEVLEAGFKGLVQRGFELEITD